MRIIVLLVCLFVAACNSYHASAPDVVSFGDSISKGIAGPTRVDLWPTIDFRHDSWEEEGITPRDDDTFYAAQIRHGRNNGCSATLLSALRERLPGTYYAAIVLAVGYHDFQLDVNSECGGVSPTEYEANMTEAVALAKAHAAVVILPDVESIPAGLRLPVGAEAPYNQVLHRLARETGAYTFQPEWPTVRVAGVHFDSEGYKRLGEQLAACVQTALAGEETEKCHH